GNGGSEKVRRARVPRLRLGGYGHGGGRHGPYESWNEAEPDQRGDQELQGPGRGWSKAIQGRVRQGCEDERSPRSEEKEEGFCRRLRVSGPARVKYGKTAPSPPPRQSPSGAAGGHGRLSCDPTLGRASAARPVSHQRRVPRTNSDRPPLRANRKPPQLAGFLRHPRHLPGRASGALSR